MSCVRAIGGESGTSDLEARRGWHNTLVSDPPPDQRSAILRALTTALTELQMPARIRDHSSTVAMINKISHGIRSGRPNRPSRIQPIPSRAKVSEA